MARASASSRPLTDHDEIRRWAEERGAHPACVRGTGDNNDIGMIRLDFPGYSGEGKLEEISWDEWFDKFDQSGLALLVQNKTAGGQRSNFNKLVSRETAGISAAGSSKNSHSQESRPRSLGEAGARVSAGYSEDDFDNTDDDIQLEEVDVEIEEAKPVRRSAASNSRKRQSGRKRATTARSRRSSTVRGSSSQRGRSSRPKSRTALSKRARPASSARSKAKKAPARVTSSTSRTTRGRSSGRKRAA